MRITNAENDVKYIVYTEEEVRSAVLEMARKLGQDYQDKNPIVVCILKGGVFFYADLCRGMNCHLELDFLAASSYGSGTVSSGNLKIKKDMEHSVIGRHVILVDDIIDSGLTLTQLKMLMEERGAASVVTCCMLDKKIRHPDALQPDYAALECPNEFVVGCGLDYAEYYRSLPYVAVLKEEVYQ